MLLPQDICTCHSWGGSYWIKCYAGAWKRNTRQRRQANNGHRLRLDNEKKSRLENYSMKVKLYRMECHNVVTSE